MPRIPIYEQQVAPRGVVPYARVEAPNIAGTFATLGQGVGKAGEAAATIALRVQQAEEQQEITNAYLKIDEITTKTEQNFYNSKKQAKLNEYPTFGDAVLGLNEYTETAGTLKDELAKGRGEFTYSSAQQLYDRLASKTTHHFVQYAQSVRADLAASHAKEQINVYAGNGSRALMLFPEQLPERVGDLQTMVNDPSSSFVNIPLEKRPEMIDAIRQQFVKSAFYGDVHRNPFLAMTHLMRGDYDQYLAPGQKEEFNDYGTRAERAKEESDHQKQVRAIQEKKDDQSQRSDALLLTIDRQNAGRLGPGEEPVTSATILDLEVQGKISPQQANLITSELNKSIKEKAQDMQARNFNDVWERINLPFGNPSKITDENQLYEMRRRGDFSADQFGLLKHVLELSLKDPKTGETIKQQLDRVFKVVQPQITHSNSLLGIVYSIEDQRYAEFQVHALKKVQDYIKQKKDLAELFDIQNGVLIKDAKNYYTTNKESIAFQKQQLENRLSDQKSTAAVHEETDKKKPGESADEYLRRTGQR